MSRYFERISNEQYTVDFKDYQANYNDIILPERKTRLSAGYDFVSCCSIKIEPNEIVKIPTGIKVKLEEDEFLGIYVRSSIGFKYNIRMCNQVGIVDADYYNNVDNEGHIWICLQNQGKETYIINKGDRFVQGIFQKYLLATDDNIDSVRNGGIGSTN